MIEIEKEMEVEDSQIRCKQKTTETEKILDYDYKKCAGCAVCVVLCPKQALQEGPLKEIATGLDAPPIQIDIDACVFCGMCVNFCPVQAFKMKVKEMKKEKENLPVTKLTEKAVRS